MTTHNLDPQDHACSLDLPTSDAMELMKPLMSLSSFMLLISPETLMLFDLPRTPMLLDTLIPSML